MTPTELETYIRQRANIVGDTFFSSSEILTYVYDACLQMAREAMMIERIYTTTTVAGTNEYAYPTNTIAIKRITYDGNKLQPISFREDDQVTGLNAATLTQGTPQYYAQFNETLYLRPIPDSTKELKIFSFNEPQAIVATSALEVPSQFHLDIADYVMAMIQAKEQNFSGSTFWLNIWQTKLMKMKAWSRRRLRSDAFTGVQDLDSIAESFLGGI